ncbi:MAG: DUF6030 family protein [Shinella sp.]|nr:DUF6030 family protein [Shinella sp.]
MAEQARSRSGKVLFLVLFLCLLVAITATVLFANGGRNLNLLLARFGMEPIFALAPPAEQKGDEAPRPAPLPRIELPDHLISPHAPLETRFIRAIRRDPRILCEALQRNGFVDSGWKQGLVEGSWECSSFREYPSAQEGAAASSTFLSIRGNQEERMTSFRIKLNLEDPDSRPQVTDAVISALEIFLEEVRWEEAPEIFENIRSLTEFDLVRFGNRIQLKREASEVPRYNFLIIPDRKRLKNPFLPDYFDRGRWLPMPEPYASAP